MGICVRWGRRGWSDSVNSPPFGKRAALCVGMKSGGCGSRGGFAWCAVKSESPSPLFQRGNSFAAR
ncbi:hypothetical protein [Lysobacter gummosus]|uniref:hypothetical protein n=1 Tax=Lysobacter gummosus TaxID=262324 RepID=UPI0036365836